VPSDGRGSTSEFPRIERSLAASFPDHQPRSQNDCVNTYELRDKIATRAVSLNTKYKLYCSGTMAICAPAGNEQSTLIVPGTHNAITFCCILACLANMSIIMVKKLDSTKGLIHPWPVRPPLPTSIGHIFKAVGSRLPIRWPEKPERNNGKIEDWSHALNA
jgi:hypothetical protein